jgi:DNA (cytosine-5)-methyltransferase 1
MSRPAYYNEIDSWCCDLLRERIATGDLPAGIVDNRDIRLVQLGELRDFGQLHFFAGIGGGAAGLPTRRNA